MSKISKNLRFFSRSFTLSLNSTFRYWKFECLIDLCSTCFTYCLFDTLLFWFRLHVYFVINYDFLSLFSHNLRKIKMSFVVNLCCALLTRTYFFFFIWFLFLLLFWPISMWVFRMRVYTEYTHIAVYAWAFSWWYAFAVYPCISAGLFASFHSILVSHLSAVSLTQSQLCNVFVEFYFLLSSCTTKRGFTFFLSLEHFGSGMTDNTKP